MLYPTGKEKEVLYSITGQWTKAFQIHSGALKSVGSTNRIASHDTATQPTAKLTVVPIKSQHPLESRRAWAPVAEAIARSDLDAVGSEKSKIENAQREARIKEKADGRLWERRYFSARSDPDPLLSSLGPQVGLAEHGDGDKTGGLWRFDAAKAEKARSQPLPSEEEAAKIAAQLLGQR